MLERLARLVAVVVVTGLLGAGCGSDGTSSGAGDGDVDPGEIPSEAVAAADAAVRFVEELGGVEAFAAAFVALDRGYDVDQLLEPDATLLGDGTIQGVDPAHEPFGVTDLVAAEMAGGGDEESMGAGGVVLAAFVPGPAQAGDDAQRTNADVVSAGIRGLELTLHEIWEGAGEEDFISGLKELLPGEAQPADAGVDDVSVRDAQVLVGILLLSLRGYSPGQIAAGMATGDIGSLDGSEICIFIDGEEPEGTFDRFESFCALVAERNSDVGTADSDDEPSTSPSVAAGEGTALDRLPTGLFEGAIDTSTGGWRDGVAIETATITLQYANGGVLVDWVVRWAEDAGECVTTGTDSWSGSEVTFADSSGFSLRGTRQFEPGEDSTCDLGAEPSSYSSVIRFDVADGRVTGDIGLGTATIEIEG